METQNSKPQHLNLVVKVNRVAVFLKLIESGFKLKIQTGLSIRELFCDQLDISDDYLDNRIQTIFFNGKPVDNVNTALVYNGARIALSAAMPGLVGAVFRKGGHYASFRHTISHSEAGDPNVKGDGEIVLKFFNMVAKELGPTFLKKGIVIEGKRFQDFVLKNSENLKPACTSIHLNDKKVDIAELEQMNLKNSEILLQVTSEKPS